MKLSSDLRSCSIPYSCEQCTLKRSCRRGTPCSAFYPENMDAFLQFVLEYFRNNVIPSKDKRLKRCVGNAPNTNGMKSDGVTTLDSYYVAFINDTLSQIRHGKIGYVFKIEHIKDVFKYEQDICVKYVDGCYAISKIKLCKL